MRHIIYYLTSLAIIGAVVFHSGCGDKPPKPNLTAQQKATKALGEGNTWQVVTVNTKPNDAVPDSDLTGLRIVFGVTGTGTNIAPATFSATGAPQFLSAGSGATWSWSTPTGNSIIALTNSSTTQLTIVEYIPDSVNPSSIRISFNVANIGGRISEIGGNYTVTLNKNQ